VTGPDPFRLFESGALVAPGLELDCYPARGEVDPGELQGRRGAGIGPDGPGRADVGEILSGIRDNSLRK
jgi:hypothetical protein